MTIDQKINAALGVLAAIFAAAVVCGFYAYEYSFFKEALIEAGKDIKDIIHQIKEYQPSE